MPLDLRGGAYMFSQTNYRRDIQALRGLSVLAVVLFHAEESYFPLGYLGVDIFFVISGFVVTPLILRIFTDQVNGGGRLSNLKFFYKRRFYRLAPALAVMLVISAVSIFLLGPINDWQRFARQGIATLLLVGNLGAYTYSGNYFSSNPNPLVHSWSLSVEEQIYIVLPLIMMLILHNRRSLKKITAVVFGVISVLSFISFLFPTILEPLYSRVGIELASQFSFYSPTDRIWQFTVGGLTFLLLDQYQNHIRKIPKNIHLLIVIVVIMILFGTVHVNLTVSSILASLFAVIIILFKSLDVLPNFVMQRLVWVGDRSYSIYLVHMPLLYLAKYSPTTQIGSGENPIIQSTIGVVASVLLGALSFSKIENRYRNKGKQRPNASGILKDFIPVFVGPLTIFLLLSGVSGTNNTPMYKDRLDNGICKFWTSNLDGNFHSRFLKCQSKFGRAVVVLGDSHSMNIYNSLFLTTRSNFFVGISKPGCRPQSQLDFCNYDDFKRFLKLSPNSIEQVIFNQSGSFLISSERGEVDNYKVFKSQDSYHIVDEDIQFLINYLNEMGKNVSVTWIGPFPGLFITEPTWIQAKRNQVKPNPIVKKAFLDLEKQIVFHLKNQNNTFRYVSLSRILGYRQFEYKVGSCILFRDLDHWSTCGEEMFSLQIQKSL